MSEKNIDSNKKQSSKKLPYVRRQQILEMLKQNEFMEISQFSDSFNVSYMTILRDIEHLVSNGEVKRVYGGVEIAKPEIQNVPTHPDLSFQLDNTLEERFKENAEYKEAIGKKAASLVCDGDYIGMDASTTLLPMCSYLHNMHVTVVTNSITVALMFSTSATVNVILLGGVLRKPALTTVAHYICDMSQSINLQKCFVSSKSLSFEKGMTDLTLDEAEAKKSLIGQATEVCVLVDHTKINRISPFRVCSNENIHTIITDQQKNMDEGQLECLNRFAQSGVNVMYSGE